MVRLLLGRTRQVRPVETPSWEPPRVRTLSDLSPPGLAPGEPAEQTTEPSYWELGTGAVVLRGGVLHLLNETARALWVAITNEANEESAVATVAEAWHADPDAIREVCLVVLAQLRSVAAPGKAE